MAARLPAQLVSQPAKKKKKNGTHARGCWSAWSPHPALGWSRHWYTPLAGPDSFIQGFFRCVLPPVSLLPNPRSNRRGLSQRHSGRARLTWQPSRMVHLTSPAPVACVVWCVRRVRAGGDGEWAELGAGVCGEDGERVTTMTGSMGATGEVGLTKCKAACEQRRPHCVAVSYMASIGLCGLHGSKLKLADRDARGDGVYFGIYDASHRGSDRITSADNRAGWACSVFTPSEPGDREWWPELGVGQCLDEGGKSVTEVRGYVGATGAAGLAKCKAACEQRRPRCVAVTYSASAVQSDVRIFQPYSPPGHCRLHGSKVRRGDKDGVFKVYSRRSGSDKITRTGSNPNYVCSVFTPGKPKSLEADALQTFRRTHRQSGVRTCRST